MIEKGIYFGKNEFYELIRKIGGKWNDGKERPIVTLIKSTEHEDLYWAIPMGDARHRTVEKMNRILGYINRPNSDIASCYYHIGKTTTKSIFFISDAVPIIDKYIDRFYLGYDQNHYIIKNPNLILELQRKLERILAYENSNNNFFRQHITDIKATLLQELELEKLEKEAAIGDMVVDADSISD